MSTYLNIPIKCPVCGESKDIVNLGKVDLDGLDPLMEHYRCEREFRKYKDNDKYFLKVIKTWKCNTEFYIAPKPNYVEVKR